MYVCIGGVIRGVNDGLHVCISACIRCLCVRVYVEGVVVVVVGAVVSKVKASGC